MAELVELEIFRRRLHRQVWFGMGGLVVVSVAALGVALVAFARPIPVVVFDGAGRPVLFEDTATPRLRMEQVRVEWFARHFLEAFSAVDSTAVEENITRAVNLMSPTLRRIFLADEKEMARRRKHAELNLKGRFEGLTFQVADFDAEDAGAKIYLVATGRMVFRPKLGEMRDEEPPSSSTTTRNWCCSGCPSPETPPTASRSTSFGRGFFDTSEDLEVYVLKEQGQ
jgi:hypothetical protein